MSDAWGGSWGTAWSTHWVAGTPTVPVSDLKIMSMRLNPQLSVSMNYTGDSIPISLVSAVPTVAPASGKGLVAYISGGTLKLAAWDGAAWVST